MSIFELCLVIFTLGGFLCIGLGLYSLKRDSSFIASEKNFQRELTSWHIFEDTPPSPGLYAVLKQSWSQLRALMLLGGGIGTLLMAVILIVISLATAGTIEGSGAKYATFFVPLFLCGIFAGSGIAGIYTLWNLRKTTDSYTTGAGPQSRHLSDYRTRLFRWLPLIILVELLAFSGYFTPHLGATLRLPQGSGAPVDVPYTPWLIVIAPITIIVLSLIAECLMVHIVRLPRLLFTSNLTISQRADDMLRVTIIGTVQRYALFAIALFALQQDSLIVNSLWASGYWSLSTPQYNWISALFLLLLLATIILGAGLVALRVSIKKSILTGSIQRGKHTIRKHEMDL